MVINESTAYKRDYKKIIINKHMIKEKEKIENIKINTRLINDHYKCDFNHINTNTQKKLSKIIA